MILVALLIRVPVILNLMSCCLLHVLHLRWLIIILIEEFLFFLSWDVLSLVDGDDEILDGMSILLTLNIEYGYHLHQSMCIKGSIVLLGESEWSSLPV